MKLWYLMLLPFLLIGVRAEAAKPDIVLILVDDFGVGEVGPLGHKATHTPTIDAFAAQGVNFTNAYATPVCATTRAQLLTMRFNQEVGVWGNPLADSQSTWGLPQGVRTFADVLQKGGYETWHIGKSHSGRNAWQHPLELGFEHFYGYINGDHPFYVGKLIDQRKQVTFTGYLTDVFADHIVDILKKPHTKPQFVYFASADTHDPQDPPPGSDCGGNDNCIFQAKVARVDLAIKRIKAASRPGTVFFFAGDNGCVTAVGCSNGPLRGGKGNKYEGGIRVPLIIAGTSAHGTNHNVVSTMDIGPTILRVAGLAVPGDADGVDIRTKSHAWLTFTGKYGENFYAVRSGKWKLYRRALYDLSVDIGESHDVAAGNKEVVARLKKIFDDEATKFIPSNG